MSIGYLDSRRMGFLTGLSRVLDLGSTLDAKDCQELFDIDYHAIKQDWIMVGRDLSIAINQFDEEQRDKK